jgi:hypothetical protein
MTVDDSEWEICRESWRRIKSIIQGFLRYQDSWTGTMGLFWGGYGGCLEDSLEMGGADACTLITAA